jgi:S1-C subfamily serine protease
MGIPTDVVADMVGLIQRDEQMRSLEVEWQTMPLATVRKFNLPEEWARRYEDHDADRREMLAVGSTVAGSPAAQLLRSGDVLLAIDGNPANKFREVERAMQAESVELTVLRDSQELSFDVETVELDGIGIDRVVSWAGASLQMPHRALSAQRGIGPGGVYVAYFNFGSPASRSELFAGRRVVAVDGEPTPDLDRFVAVVRQIGDGESVRLNTVSWNNVPQVITLKLDEQYWPSYELVRRGNEWVRSPLK